MKSARTIAAMISKSNRAMGLIEPKPPTAPDPAGIARPGASLAALEARNAACSALGTDPVAVFGKPRSRRREDIRVRARVCCAMAIGPAGTTFDLSEIGRACDLDHSVVSDYVHRYGEPDKRASLVAERAKAGA